MVVPQVSSFADARTLEAATDLQELASLALDELYAAALVPALEQAGYFELADAARAGGMQGLTEHVPDVPSDLAATERFADIAGRVGPHEAARLLMIERAEPLADFRELDENRAAYDLALERVGTLERGGSEIPRYYVVKHGDTLESIADALYRDPERWPDVIEQYQLYPPYFSDTPAAGLLSVGTRLLLPSVQRPGEEARLGYTFALDASRGPGGYGQEWDLIAEEGAGLAVDAGLNAFATDLALRLATPLGSLENEPRYGVAPIAGLDRSREGVVQEIAAIQSLLEDERVDSVITRPRHARIPVTGVLVGDVVAVPRPDLLEG